MNLAIINTNPQIAVETIDRFGIAGGFAVLLYWVLNRHTKEMERIYNALQTLTTTIDRYLEATRS